MKTCPVCSTTVTENALNCPSCGASLAALAPTVRAPLPKATSSTPRRSQSGSTSSPREARFVAGAMLGGRYRLLGLVGRGGMGEVYKAEDLKLDQVVALKFLPEDFAKDQEALERFYREVRIARQVSHPNVCRVFDIGEVEGSHFISMEFIDGDDLSSLLRRIGRLPSDKATEIARQLCFGLHAIHQAGILHRDLKPANVIIDGQGKARITDFGIAGLAHELEEGGSFAGTPAYMSPEQAAGKELTTSSDIYSLGLLFYEIFSGKRAFDATTLHELIRKHRSDSPQSLSELVRDVDPQIEQIVFHCLEKDPRHRPASALRVAVALPGGNALAAAIAAGETPTPEMVASAPTKGALRPLIATALLVTLIAGIGFSMLISKRVALHRYLPLSKSPEVLRERGRELAEKFGYRGTDSVYGFDSEREYLNYINQHDQSSSRWQKLATGQPAVYRFWYRQSPEPLVPLSYDRVTTYDPPTLVAGMAQIHLDTKGRLIFVDAVPPTSVDAAAEVARGNLDWASVFTEAGFNLNDFSETDPQWTPPRAFDVSRAWTGTYPEQPDIPIRVEAAAYRGRLVNFRIVEPWSKPKDRPSTQGAGSGVDGLVLAGVFFVVLIIGSWLAFKNVRAGRSDMRGAFRVALFLFGLRIVNSILAKHHVASIDEFWLFLASLYSAVFWSCFVGFLYLAFEPYLRRHAPERVISWNRLLAGDWRDPLVGRDVLIGGVVGMSVVVLAAVAYLVPGWLGKPPSIPVSLANPNGAALLGFRGFPILFLTQVGSSIIFAFGVAFLILFFSLLFRRRWIGKVTVWILIFTFQFLGDLSSGGGVNEIITSVVFSTALVLIAARFGVLATVSMFTFLHLVVFYPFTTELTAWYAADFVLCAVVLLLLAVYGFYASLAGQPLLKGKLIED